jgi:hypothetical protein
MCEGNNARVLYFCCAYCSAFNSEGGEEGLQYHRNLRQVVRSYRGDVSRLTDVCRQSVVFNDLAGVAACLRTITADPEVAVLRVKNRLDPAYDTRTSGGYR